jgi:hypothetical protein
MNQMNLEIVMKIIQMHFELFSRSWWSLNFSPILWMCSWDFMIIKLSWRFWYGWGKFEILRSSKWSWRLLEIVGMWFEILIIKMELEILECDWRSWDHGMELEIVGDHDHQIESWEIVKSHHDHYWFEDCEMIVIFIKTMLWTYPFIHLSIMIKNNNEIHIPKTLLRTHPIHHNKSWIPNTKKENLRNPSIHPYNHP